MKQLFGFPAVQKSGPPYVRVDPLYYPPKVFELLVRTSCAEHSAQYFLLTPKLLTGLNYSERMTILIVNNGEGMCSYQDWNMEAFHAIAGS